MRAKVLRAFISLLIWREGEREKEGERLKRTIPFALLWLPWVTYRAGLELGFGLDWNAYGLGMRTAWVCDVTGMRWSAHTVVYLACYGTYFT